MPGFYTDTGTNTDGALPRQLLLNPMSVIARVSVKVSVRQMQKRLQTRASPTSQQFEDMMLGPSLSKLQKALEEQLLLHLTGATPSAQHRCPPEQSDLDWHSIGTEPKPQSPSEQEMLKVMISMQQVCPR